MLSYIAELTICQKYKLLLIQSKKKAKSMLVILTDRQILSTQQVCSGCLMAVCLVGNKENSVVVI
jgi:hypothetical protein